MRPLRALFSIAGLHPEAGGPTRSVVELCGALARAGAEVEIVSLHYGDATGAPVSLPPGVSVRFVDCSRAAARRAQWTPRFASVLRGRCASFGAEVLHDTGVWLLTNHAAARISRHRNLPRVVSPRGMLSGWALRHKGWKKRVAWWLYQRRDLQTAAALHATSRAEMESLRSLGLTRPIAVIPNGVELPPEPARAAVRPTEAVRTVLFLGRIHPVKGLLDLVEAWAAVRANGWRVVLAGGDESGHRAEVEAAIRAHRLEKNFEFAGAVSAEGRWALYREADLFVLPSRSENFGLVVAEALACGLPVITTRGTPWEELLTHRCGWWVEPNAAALADALRDALSRSDAERRQMGARGRELVRSRYTWSAAAAKMLAVYHWLLGRGPRPECVAVGGEARG
ncbi:MAG: glycosyltransferase [Verrucomicrobiae bacterium]|nr:glycosyltransferase [Verrucomicrobiae bacterium]MDW8308644.1 glycosyltransferase [Verrucomicrobiales bacterium]